MKGLIALTSSDGVMLDQKFACCRDFMIVQVDYETGAWDYVESRAAQAYDDSLLHSTARVEQTGALLSDCDYLLTRRIGNYPSAILLAHGILSIDICDSVSNALQRLTSKHRHAAVRRVRFEA